MLLKNLPAPFPAHEHALGELVAGVYEQQNGGTRAVGEEIDHTVSVVSAMIWDAGLPDVQLVLYGSRASGCALKHSDVNLDVNTERCKDIAPHVFARIAKVLKADKSGASMC